MAGCDTQKASLFESKLFRKLHEGMHSFTLIDVPRSSKTVVEGIFSEKLQSFSVTVRNNLMMEATSVLTLADCSQRCDKLLMAFVISPTNNETLPLVQLEFESPKVARDFYEFLSQKLASNKIKLYRDDFEAGVGMHFKYRLHSRFLFTYQHNEFLTLSYDESLLKLGINSESKVSHYVKSLLPSLHKEEVTSVAAYGFDALQSYFRGVGHALFSEWIAKSPPSLQYVTKNHGTISVLPHSKQVSKPSAASALPRLNSLDVTPLEPTTLLKAHVSPVLALYLFENRYLSTLPEPVASEFADFIEASPNVDRVGITIARVPGTDFFSPVVSLQTANAEILASQFEDFVNAQLIAKLGFDIKTNFEQKDNLKFKTIEFQDLGKLFLQMSDTSVEFFLIPALHDLNAEYSEFLKDVELSIAINNKLFNQHKTSIEKGLLKEFPEVLGLLNYLSGQTLDKQSLIQIHLSTHNFLVQQSPLY